MVSAIPWLGKLFDFRRNITFMFFLKGISLIDVLQDEYLREVQKATWFEAIRARISSNFELCYGTNSCETRLEAIIQDVVFKIPFMMVH